MPERIGEYRILGQLGAGGQGAVYLAESPLRGQVAIKVLHDAAAADPAARRRFLREAQVAASVAPFCTARVLDIGTLGELPYIVSEYVPGPSLLAMVREHGPRTGSGLHRLAISTLTALASIHRAGIVHRDVKPGNVILGPEGPVLIDFGIARALDAITTNTQVTGTPAFMSPELLAGEAVTPASDIFSWAVTMVFAATGRLAFTGDNIPAILHAVLNKEPDLTGVPEPLRTLVGYCLAKDPADRPSAEYLLGELTSAQGGWGGEGAPSVPPVAGGTTASLRDQETRPIRRPLIVAGTVLAGLAVAVGAVLVPYLLSEGSGSGDRIAERGTSAASAGTRPPLDLAAFPVLDTSDEFDELPKAAYRTHRPFEGEVAPSTGVERGRFVADGRRFYSWFALPGAPSASATVTIITLNAFTGSGENEDSVFVGRIKDGANFVGAWYNNTRQEAGIDAFIDGRRRHIDNSARVALGPGDRLALVVSSDGMLSSYAFSDGTWRRLTTIQVALPEEPQYRAQWLHGFAVRGTTGPIALDAVEGRSADS